MSNSIRERLEVEEILEQGIISVKREKDSGTHHEPRI